MKHQLDSIKKRGDWRRNAALMAVAILANSLPELREPLKQFCAEQSGKVLRETL